MKISPDQKILAALEAEPVVPKECCQCHEFKNPTECFGVDNSRPDRRNPICKDCRKPGAVKVKRVRQPKAPIDWENHQKSDNGPASPRCPDCGSRLKETYRKDGQLLLCCTGYPKCRYTQGPLGTVKYWNGKKYGGKNGIPLLVR